MTEVTEENVEMASFWSRIKFMYLGRKSIARFALPLVLLTVIVVILRWAVTPPGMAVHHYDNEFKFRDIDESQINDHLEILEDTRSAQCVETPYTGSEMEKISILLDFNEHQFFDLHLTLESILKFTPSNHFHEIVLLDDGSADAEVQKHAERYLADPKFSMVKAFRSDSSDGPALSRFKASKIAVGSILVFLNSDVVVTKGWLQPLVDHVQRNRKCIAVPHADSILSGFRHFKTAENLINVPSLSLTTLFFETSQTGTVLNTPVMTGAAFAVDKQFLDGIGSFDDGLLKGGGENLELSLRTWLCGGAIQVVTCSRVAVRDALLPVKINSKRNFQRIAELWLDDTKRVAYGQREHLFDPNENDRQSLQSRKFFLKKMTHCSDFNHYLSKVAPMIKLPPAGASLFGKLRAKTGYCLTRMPENGQMLKMVHCRPHMYEPDLFFELDKMGRLSRNSQCIELIFNGDVRLTSCESKKADQWWDFGKEGRLENAAKKNKCLTHHSDYETVKNYLVASACEVTDRGQLWEFVKY